jgi:hypothetical protein
MISRDLATEIVRLQHVERTGITASAEKGNTDEIE